MTDDIILSIIVPVYNAGRYIEAFMDSIVRDTDDESSACLEVITVDDGSKDDSLKMLGSYAEKHSFIKVIHQENAGPAAARNTGLSAAKGRWIYLADPDDRLNDGAIGKLIKIGKSDSTGTDIFLFDAIEHRVDKTSAWEHYDSPRIYTDVHDIRKLMRGMLYPYEADTVTPLAAPWDKLYRMSFLRDNNLCFNEDLRVLDDMFFNMEAFGCALKVEYIKYPVYHYVRNTGSITSSYVADRVERDMKVWDAIERYIERYSGREDVNGSEIALLIRAFCKRIVKSFAISTTLCLFNPNNTAGFKEQLKRAKEVLSMDIYRKAFLSLKPSELEWKLRPILIFGRHRMALPIYILAKLQMR